MSKTLSSRWVTFIKSLHSLSGTSRYILFSVIFITLSSHIALSLYFKDFTWLAAFGALLSIFGILTSFSYSFPLIKVNPRDLQETNEDDTYTRGGFNFGEVIDDKETIERIKQANIDSALKKYENISLYILLTVTGTVTWAYAGFLNLLFYK